MKFEQYLTYDKDYIKLSSVPFINNEIDIEVEEFTVLDNEFQIRLKRNTPPGFFPSTGIITLRFHSDGISVTRDMPMAPREYLQYDIDGSLVFLPTPPYKSTKRKPFRLDVLGVL